MIKFEKPLKLDDCLLYAAGHTVSSVPFDVDEGQYRIISVTSGTGKVCLSDKCISVKEKDVYIFFPYEKAAFLGDFEFDFVCLSVNTGRYGEYLGFLKIDSMSGEGKTFTDDNVRITLGKIIDELSMGTGFFSHELLSLFCSLLIVYILRAFDEGVYEKNGDEANFKVCSLVMNYIDSHVYTMKNLREVAAAMGYNYSYISTLFHKTTGVTLNGYFKNKRMNEAKKLLGNNKNSISEIARMMNYSSVYAFSKAFKEHFGMSPGHFSGRFTK